MSYAAIRDAIVARLETVTDIGRINDYRRGITTREAFDAAFVATIDGVRQVRGWDVAWESGEYRPNGWQDDGTMRMSGTHTYVVRGYLSQNDADGSDKVMSALVVNVMRALATCKAAIEPRESHVPVTLRSNGFLTFEAPGFGGLLVNYTEIAITVLDDEVV